MSTFYKLAIKDIVRETSNAVSVEFTIPAELQNFYTFVAGQYVNLKLTLDGKEIRRAYSICSTPDSKQLKITIKAVPNGLFSNFANHQLKVGNLLQVGIPEGKFTFVPSADNQNNYIAFVAGSGITPVMSILQTVLLQEPNSTFVLVYGNKTPQDTIYYNQLLDLQAQYASRFSVHFVYTQTANDLQGRIDNTLVTHLLNQKYADTHFSKYFLCGPEAMITTVSTFLNEKKVPQDDIKFELFTASTTEAAITTNTENASVTIIVDGDATTFEMPTKQTILEAALKQGIDAPYSCQGGICSSCIALVTEGSTEMRKNSILTEKEVAQGLTLTCQAHPTSASVTIDFDQV